MRGGNEPAVQRKVICARDVTHSLHRLRLGRHASIKYIRCSRQSRHPSCLPHSILISFTFFQFTMVAVKSILCAAVAVVGASAAAVEEKLGSVIDSVISDATSLGGTIASGATSLAGDFTSLGNGVFETVTSAGGHAYTIVTSAGGAAVTLAPSEYGKVTSTLGSVYTVATGDLASVYASGTSAAANAATNVRPWTMSTQLLSGLAAVAGGVVAGAYIIW
ncbi:hypothetical protein OE88DRAFT_87674 [Heliocybe sulcata]|uniref:Uncharacterized protein n=1 Tax=Heliocybe sulcata TaxID=5364 RepID=A0A5C3NI32_9AGAM|nr:hypothetical protein OE88DRAFT_87674 [Heliocybe sulcata]